MKHGYPAALLIVVSVFVFNLFPQDYKQDSLAVRAILDSNGLGSVTVESVSKVGNNRIDTLIITAKNLSKLPAVIGTITKLKFLDLHDNSLKTLPPEIGSLIDIVFMDLRQNSIEALPSTIGSFGALSRLFVSSNALKSLPAEIGQLSNLGNLYLEMNQITALPSQIGNLTNLTMLWIHFNQLSSIPAGIGRLTKLKTLFAGNNKLVTLPDSIALLKPSSGGLDISNNNLDTNTISKPVLAWADQYDPDWRATQTIEIKNIVLHQIEKTLLIACNPKTIKITYTIPAACRIKIDLYDIQGKSIYAVVNEHQAKGRHSATVARSRLGSNMHYLRFFAEGYGTFTKPIVPE